MIPVVVEKLTISGPPTLFVLLLTEVNHCFSKETPASRKVFATYGQDF